MRRDPFHLKRPWCWERLRAGGEGDDRGWDGWMVSPTQWTWVWVDSRSWWWTGRLGVLWFMGSQRVGHDWVTELNWLTDTKASVFLFPLFQSTNLSRFSTPPPKQNFYLMNIYGNFLWKGDMNAEGIKKWKSLSDVWPSQLHQDPLSMDFSRPEYQNGLPLIPQGVFPTQESNPGFPYCRQIPNEPPETLAKRMNYKFVSFSNCSVQSLLAPLCDFSLNSQSL